MPNEENSGEGSCVCGAGQGDRACGMDDMARLALGVSQAESVRSTVLRETDREAAPRSGKNPLERVLVKPKISKRPGKPNSRQ